MALTLDRARSYLDRAAPLVVVRGIRGYGKTTLVAGWLRDQPESTVSAWMYAQPDSPARALVDALSRALTRARRPHPVPQRPDLLRRAADLIDALVDAGEQFVLVVDDAQLLRDVAVLDVLLGALTRHDRMRLILCSRGRHPIEARAAGRVDLVTVPARALLLTADEVRELARRLDVAVSPQQAERLVDDFGGWPAAVRAVLDAADGHAELPVAAGEQYLVETVLPGIGDQQTLRDVMRFCLAERLTHRLVRAYAIGQNRSPDELVRLIESPGLAERRYVGAEVELVYPAFIRRTLRAEFGRRYPDEARAVHRWLAGWYLEQPGEAVRAFEHAARAADWPLVEHVWSRCSAHLLLVHPRVVVDVFGAAPPEFVAARRSVVLGLEIAAGALSATAARDPQLAALRAYSRAPAIPELGQLSLHDLQFAGVGRLIALRMAGRFEPAERFAEQLEDAIATRIGAGDDPGDRRGWFWLQRGLTATLQHRYLEAIRAYERAWETRPTDAVHITANVTANLALVNALVADPDQARLWLDRHAHYDTGATWGHYLVGAGAHLATGRLAVDALDPHTAATTLDHLGDGSDALELWPLVVALNAAHHLHFCPDKAAALDALDRAVQAHPPDLTRSHAAVTLLTRARAELLIAAGQGNRALRELQPAPAQPLHPVTAVALARISLLGGQLDHARRLVEQTVWEPATDRRSRLELLLIGAQAANRMQAGDDARRLMSHVAGLGRRTRTLAALATIPADERADLLGRAAVKLAPDDAARLADTPCPYPERLAIVELTERERHLAAHLAQTSSRQEIADRLYVSVNTVRAQLGTLYRKLDAANRSQAVRRLHELGLLAGTVETRGIEPLTPALQRRCSAN